MPTIARHLSTLNEVGLGYVRLGQSAPTLSGGEAQRVKLASELQKRSTGRTVYVLDEPTTGLHFEDISKLIKVLSGLVDKGNTVIVIEHNLDVIKTADWVVDMGPEGGNGGGLVVAEGTPEEVAVGPGQPHRQVPAGDPRATGSATPRRRATPAKKAGGQEGRGQEAAAKKTAGQEDRGQEDDGADPPGRLTRRTGPDGPSRAPRTTGAAAARVRTGRERSRGPRAAADVAAPRPRRRRPLLRRQLRGERRFRARA